MGCLSCLKRKKKNFSLNHELDVKTSATESFPNPKRTRWLNFIGLVLLIGFALLLILSNLDFSEESQDKTTQETTAQLELITTIRETTQETTERALISGKKYAAVQEKKPSFICNEKKSCKTIVCTGGPIHSLAYYLESFDRDCGNVYFDVIIEDCTFYEKTIAQYTMSGLYNMNSLTIRNCELGKIVDTAFNQATVKKLINLTFEAVQLNFLNAKSFMGLQALEHFTLINTQQAECTALSFKSFLQPMANTLRTLVLQQTQMSCSVAASYKPADWLGGNARFDNLLDVDLSGTNLSNTLNHETFLNLSAVLRLSLANCSLTVISGNTFDSVLTTLRLLDLRNNNLHLLDGEFLSLATLASISIDMRGNQWSCLCDNEAVVEFVQQSEKSYSTGVQCAWPSEMRGVEIRDVQLQCDRATTIIITTTKGIPIPEIKVSPGTESTTLEISESVGNTLLPKPPQGDHPTPVKPVPPKTTTLAPIYTTELPADYQGCDFPLPEILTCNNMTASCCNGNFSMEVLSPTSIRVHIGSYDTALSVIYFESFSYSAITLREIERRTPASFYVHNLKSNKSYTFCLVQYQQLKTSPFDCRSVYLPMEAPPSWLNNNDKSTFYTIVICLTLVCCIIGVIVIYCLLRWRPTLLPQEVYIYAKSDNSKIRSSFSADGGTKDLADIKFYDNIQYYRTSDLNKHRIVSHNLPPVDRAPAAPHPYIDVLRTEELQTEGDYVKNRHSLKNREVFPENKQAETNITAYDFDNVYESLDYYQKVY